MKSCENCGTPTPNPKFCGRSCAAKVNNKVPKRKRVSSSYTCGGCGAEIGYSRKYCPAEECQPNYVDWSRVTLREAQGKRRYQRNSRIRDLARKQYLRSSGPKACVVCGYDVHFDVCHIRGISDFPELATVAEINDLRNLVALCKNHHWELDQGILKPAALFN